MLGRRDLESVGLQLTSMDLHGKRGGGMKRFLTVMIVATVGFACACSSGGSGGGPGQSGLTAGFIADQSSPGPDSVAAGQESNSIDTVTVEITVTNTDDVYAASFDLVYDASNATYLGWDPGTLLEQGGQTVNYNVSEPSAGRLVVSASRQGNVPGADAIDTRTVIELTFRVDAVGNSTITFQANTLLDSQQQPQQIPGISWFGGTLTGI